MRDSSCCERDVHGARHVACGKLAFGTNVKNAQGLASIDALEEFHDRDRPVGIDHRRWRQRCCRRSRPRRCGRCHGRPAKGQGEQSWRPCERPREELHDVVAAAGGWTPPENVHHEVERHAADDGGGKASSGNGRPGPPLWRAQPPSFERGEDQPHDDPRRRNGRPVGAPVHDRDEHVVAGGPADTGERANRKSLQDAAARGTEHGADRREQQRPVDEPGHDRVPDAVGVPDEVADRGDRSNDEHADDCVFMLRRTGRILASRSLPRQVCQPVSARPEALGATANGVDARPAIPFGQLCC